ncbi:cation:proton antiporter, partial [Nanoarchaeota archaeon]
MALTALSVLTSLVVVLLIGLLVSLISEKFKIPDALVLILVGMGLGYLEINGQTIIQFPDLFMTTTAMLALALILFDSSTKIKLRTLNVFSLKSLKLTGSFLFFEMVLFTIAAIFILQIPISLAILFAALVSGSSSDVMFSMFSGVKHKIVEIIKFESIFNTPITVILPFIIANIIVSVDVQVVSELLGVFEPVLIKIIAGIGSGLLLFVLLYKIVSRRYSKIYTPLSVIVSAILAYVLAETINGDGVLSVITLGLLFGNFVKKKKTEVLQYESILSKALYVLVFILMGLLIKIPWEAEFFVKSIALFLIYVLIRLFVVVITLTRENLTMGEKI